MVVDPNYVDNTAARFVELEQQVAKLLEEQRQAAEREEQLKIKLRQREEELELFRGQTAQANRPPLTAEDADRETAPVPPMAAVADNGLQASYDPHRQPGPILGHIGRMYADDRGQGQFLGAHTGNHFLASALQLSRDLLGEDGGCPDWVSELFFTKQPFFVFRRDASRNPTMPSLPGQTLPFYEDQIAHFCHDWDSLFPIVDADSLLSTIARLLLRGRQDGDEMTEEECCAVFQLNSILALNMVADDASPPRAHEPYCAVLASLFPRILEIARAESLRCLVLYTLLLQLEGRAQLALQLSGVIARLAQSLGLHRHSRRFRHQPSEVERRRRLWWCVFIFDTNTTIHRGIPRLIRPADVDIDLSARTGFSGHSIQQLPVLLPGKTFSPLSLFRQQIALYQILSETVDQLYTTWNRRGSVAKIRSLDDKLATWRRAFRFHSVVQPKDTSSSQDEEPFAVVRLRVLSEFARIFIHRPALTFAHTEPQFRESLVASLEAGDALLAASQGTHRVRRLLRIWPLSLAFLLQLGVLFLYPFWTDDPPCPLDAQLLRDRISAVKSLLAWLDARDTRTGLFLATLCEKTLAANETRRQPQRQLERYSAGMGGLLQQSLSEQANCADWQSLMLPNEFLISEWDLSQSFGQRQMTL
ncbi:Transcription factor [Niveomyces insectorum RCEF 264]|uniref:Transcription factor n=1 Tax=Niveomyces insectorum RCEF 264 TaxID=1081102 RepID=A0A162J965_9HYPO|nr:Transcription factor [Niveomyces insectorum RCEF 264]